jgi:hypothetical protein
MKWHPDVAAELEKRRRDDPDTCNHPCGAVYPTAKQPDPKWCPRPFGHAGLHMSEARYAEYKALATERQRRKRSQS